MARRPAGKQMTAKDFRTLLPRLKRMTVGNVEVARRVLVDGIPQTVAAQECGLTVQRVNAVIKAVLAAAQGIPMGWQQVEVWLPPDLADRVRAMAEEARAAVSQES